MIAEDSFKTFSLIDSHLQGGKLLDIGCGKGDFLQLVSERDGNKWQLFGIDINEYEAAFARERLGATIYTGAFEESNLPGNFFDIVTLWATLEHLPDPSEAMQKISKIIKDKGMLIIKVPYAYDLFFLLARLIYRLSFGHLSYYVQQCIAYHHLYFFSKQTLNRLFSLYGFKILRSFGGEFYFTKFALKKVPLSYRFIFSAIAKVSKICNCPQTLTVFAKRHP